MLVYVWQLRDNLQCLICHSAIKEFKQIQHRFKEESSFRLYPQEKPLAAASFLTEGKKIAENKKSFLQKYSFPRRRTKKRKESEKIQLISIKGYTSHLIASGSKVDVSEPQRMWNLSSK